MKKTLIAMVVGAGLILLVSPDCVQAGSASVRNGEHVEWVERRTEYRFHSDPGSRQNRVAQGNRHDLSYPKRWIRKGGEETRRERKKIPKINHPSPKKSLSSLLFRPALLRSSK